MPAASSRWRTRNAVVVLPLVPVMPTTRSSAVGSPWKRAAAGPIAARTSGTSTSGTPRPSGRSHTSAAAPRSTASGAKSWPSARKPGTQKNSVPGRTRGCSSRPGPDLDLGGRPSPISSRRFMARRSLGAPGPRQALRRRSRSTSGRDAQVRQRELHDLLEGRGRHHAAVDSRPGARRPSPPPAGAGRARARSR